MHVFAYAGAAAFYLAASVRYAVRFARARPGRGAPVAVLFYSGVLVHVAGLALYWRTFGELPLVGLGPSLGTLALLIGLAVAGLGFFADVRAVGLVLAPVAALLLLLAILAGIEPASSAMQFRQPWLVLHVSISFLGYACWVVAAATAFMYLLQFRQLKHKRLGAVFQFFPALETLDKLSEWSLVVGFSALTLGILVGSAWTVRFEAGLRWTDPKVIWGILAWLALFLAVWSRFNRRHSSRQAAVWNVAGFGLVFMAYLVAKLLISGTGFFL